MKLSRSILKVNVVGGNGLVSGHGIDCEPVCQGTFYGKAEVTLVANAGLGSSFQGWSGGGCSGTGVCVVTLTANTTVTATFLYVPPVMASVSGKSNGESFNPAVSADGRVVAFESIATNLAAGATNQVSQIYLYDQATEITDSLSVNSLGTEGDQPSRSPAISSDGMVVAFESAATNLAPECSSGLTQIFVRDGASDTIECISLGTAGEPGNGPSLTPSLSADGRVVAFVSAATNLVASGCTTGVAQIFVRDRVTKTTTCVSVGPDGAPGNGASQAPAISGDGRVIAFESEATNSSQNCTSGAPQVFVRDFLVSGTTTGCISVAPDGAPGNGPSRKPTLSGDGRVVAFESTATNLSQNCTSDVTQIFLHDLVSGTTTCISVGPGGLPGNGASQAPTLSGDGRFIAFESTATNLVGSGCTTGVAQVFLRVRVTGTTTCVSVGPDGVPGNGPSQSAALSGNGLVVAFQSQASNLFPASAAPSRYAEGISYILAAEPSKPHIISPKNGVESEPNAPISFSWTPLPGATKYLFEFTGADRQFANPNGTSPDPVNGFGGAGGGFRAAETTFETTLTTVLGQEPSAGAYQVRVIGLSSAGQPLGTFSDALTLLLGPKIELSPGARPIVITPASGSNFPQDIPITFSWASLPGVAQYGFEFAGTNRQFANPNGAAPDPVNGFGGPGGMFVVAGTSFTSTFGANIPAGTYQVRVIGLSATGLIGLFSDAVTLVIQ